MVRQHRRLRPSSVRRYASTLSAISDAEEADVAAWAATAPLDDVLAHVLLWDQVVETPGARPPTPIQALWAPSPWRHPGRR